MLNVFGLSIGVAACLLIAFYVHEETSYDKFYQEQENIFRLTTYWKQEEGEQQFATAPPLLGPMLVEQSPEVLTMVRINKGSDLTMRSEADFENPYRETNAWLVDDSFFEVFDYGLIDGDKNRLFTEPHTLVLPESTARKYFGEEALANGDVVGRTILGGGDGGTPWTVVGLMKDQPKNSHFQFDMLISRENPEALNIPNWGWNNFHTYVKLKDSRAETLASVNRSLEEIVAKHAMVSSGITIERLRELNLDWQYNLQPLADIHLNNNFIREMSPKGNRTYVNALIVIALFIVVLAVVNFVNLSTAKSAVRAKEIGVKKVLGAGRNRLVNQFLIESLAYAYAALILAFGLVEGALVILENNFGWELATSLFSNSINWFWLFLTITFVGLLAGVYPALYLTGFKPALVLKGDFRHSGKNTSARNFLVGFQFVISIGLIISSLIIREQVEFTQTKDLGFDKENVLVIQNDREIDDRREEFKAALQQHPAIKEASFSTGLPGQLRYAQRDFSVEGSKVRTGVNWFEADDSYLKTLDLSLVEGRDFDRSFASDSSALLLNESAVEELRLSNPIGSYLTINKGDNDEKRVRVIGVLKDFNMESFDQQIKPLAITFLDNYNFKDYISIRLQSDNLRQSIKEVEATWREFEPNVPMVYSFLDQDFDQLFRSEQRLSRIFGAFTLLAIFIACIGLFGLASYVSEQRTKEMGIRKVLGASLASILGLLYSSYLRLILISFALAATMAFYFMDSWLQDFAYRIELTARPFLLALGGAIVLALITVGHQTLKTAFKNPVETLKTE